MEAATAPMPIDIPKASKVWGFAALFVSLPFYLMPSGKPQISDFLLVLFVSLPALLGKTPKNPLARSGTSLFGAFVGYAFVCNLIWFLVNGDRDFLYASAFLCFNFSIFLGIAGWVERTPQTACKAVYLGFGASLLLLAALSFPFSGRSYAGRLYLFFNNPNQLAYFVVCAAALTLLAGTWLRVPRTRMLPALLAALYLAVRTDSRAGMLATAPLPFLLFVRRPGRLMALAVPLILIFAAMDAGDSFDASSSGRWDNIDQSDPTAVLEDRGIDRMLDAPEHLLLGAGEGGYERFHPLGLEMHSSFASIFFCYGLPGLILVLAFFRQLFRALGVQSVLLLPVLAYGLFHNGWRLRPFWILVGLGFGLARAYVYLKDSKGSMPVAGASSQSSTAVNGVG